MLILIVYEYVVARGLVLGSWHAVIALEKFDYHLGGPVVQQMKYIATIGAGDTSNK